MKNMRLKLALNRADAKFSDVSEWAGLHYGRNLDSDSLDSQVEMIQRYQESHHDDEEDPMEFSTVETNELYGQSLNWAVARIDQQQWSDEDAMLFIGEEYRPQEGAAALRIIENNPAIGLISLAADDSPKKRCAYYDRDGGAFSSYGNTSIEAFLRAFVHREFGDRIEIPSELVADRQTSKEVQSQRQAG